MAAHLNMRKARMSAALAVSLLGWVTASGAQQLVDPTRPAHATRASAPASVEPGGGLQLQSVLISPKRREAIINGETVRAGDTVGEARVMRILESEVVLRVGDEVRVLRMYPNVEKTFPGAARRTGDRKNKQ